MRAYSSGVTFVPTDFVRRDAMRRLLAAPDVCAPPTRGYRRFLYGNRTAPFHKSRTFRAVPIEEPRFPCSNPVRGDVSPVTRPCAAPHRPFASPSRLGELQQPRLRECRQLQRQRHRLHGEVGLRDVLGSQVRRRDDRVRGRWRRHAAGRTTQGGQALLRKLDELWPQETLAVRFRDQPQSEQP
jgi:hypothetical protein